MLEQPSTSTRHHSQNLNISRTSLRRILNKDFGMKSYKIQLMQELKPHDHPMRFRFQWAEQRAWLKMSIFTEKSSFLTKSFSPRWLCEQAELSYLGGQRICTSSWRSRCIHNEWLFGVVFGPAASLGHFSSKMSKELPSLSMASAIAPC